MVRKRRIEAARLHFTGSCARNSLAFRLWTLIHGSDTSFDWQAWQPPHGRGGGAGVEMGKLLLLAAFWETLDPPTPSHHTQPSPPFSLCIPEDRMGLQTLDVPHIQSCARDGISLRASTVTWELGMKPLEGVKENTSPPLPIKLLIKKTEVIMGKNA